MFERIMSKGRVITFAIALMQSIVSADLASDFDHDGHVDLADFMVFASCITGPDGSVSDMTCPFADCNGDSRVDLVDVQCVLTSFDIAPCTGPMFEMPVLFINEAGYISGSAIADVDNDGDSDIIVTHQNGIGVLKQNAYGGFGPLVASAQVANWSGYNPTAADLDADGDIDVIAQTESFVRLFYNQASGLFVEDSAYPVGVQPNDIALSDANGDSFPDIFVADGTNRSVNVLLSIGDGTYQPAVSYPVFADAHGIVLADVDGDSVLDIITTGYDVDFVTIWFGSGSGDFAHWTTVTVGSHGLALTSGDFDGDGIVDLAVSRQVGKITVLLGTGDGMFRPPMDVLDDPSPGDIRAVHLDGDEILDLVIVCVSIDGRILTSRGRGNGEFDSLTHHPLGHISVGSFALGDLDGDRRLDCVVPVSWPRALIVLKGNEAGGFLRQVAIDGVQATSVGNYVVSADLNMDHIQDLIFLSGPIDGSDKLSVLLGVETGGFAPPREHVLGTEVARSAVADANADGTPDILLTDHDSGSISTLRGNGDGTFEFLVASNVGGAPFFLVVGDVDGNGIEDVVMTHYLMNTISVLLGQGDGSFVVTSSVEASGYPNDLVIADLDSDALLDIALITERDVELLRGSANGEFTSYWMFPDANSRYIVAFDLNHDSFTDLIFSNVMSFGAADGTFGDPIELPTAAPPSGPIAKMAVADFNGDGAVDLASALSIGAILGSLRIMPGRGDGVFEALIPYQNVYSNPRDMVPIDFDHDGDLDLAIAYSGSIGLRIAVNQCN